MLPLPSDSVELAVALGDRHLELNSLANHPEPSGNSSRIRVIIPCYDEASTVVDLLRVRAALPESQIIVVNDDSTDDSPELIRSPTQQLDLETIYCQTNLSKGVAVCAVSPLCESEYTIVQGADLEFYPTEIPKLLAVSIASLLGAECGSRYLHHYRRPSGAIGNYCAVHCLSRIIRLLFGVIGDPASCSNRIRTRLLEIWNLSRFDFELNQESNKHLTASRCRFVECQVSHHPRSNAENKKFRDCDFVTSSADLFRRTCFALVVANVVFWNPAVFTVNKALMDERSQAVSIDADCTTQTNVLWSCGIV